MNKDFLLTETHLKVLFDHFKGEPLSNVERYILLPYFLCRDKPTKDNIYISCKEELDDYYGLSKSLYEQVCRECNGDINEIVKRCKEDDDLRVFVFQYAFNCLFTYLSMGLSDLMKNFEFMEEQLKEK